MLASPGPAGPVTVFVLSPARCGGERAAMLAASRSALGRQLQTRSAPLPALRRGGRTRITRPREASVIRPRPQRRIEPVPVASGLLETPFVANLPAVGEEDAVLVARHVQQRLGWLRETYALQAAIL